MPHWDKYFESEKEKKGRQLSILGKDVHSLIRGVLIQRSSAGAKKITNYVFCHPQFSSVIQNFEILIFDSIKLIILIIIDIDKQEAKWHNDFQYFG